MARADVRSQQRRSLVLCRFTGERGFGMLLNDAFAQMVNGVTGFGMTTEDLERVGERIINLERAFNVREGVRAKMTCCRIASCMNLSPSALEGAVLSPRRVGSHAR